MVAFSIPTVIFFLVALGSSQAQNGQECCSSSYSALAFDGLRGIPATHYYDASTGNRLTVSEAAGMSRFFESATGTMYIRQGGTCTSRQNPAAVGITGCIVPGISTFQSAVTLDGQEYYRWTATAGTLRTTMTLDTNCIPKLTYISSNGVPITSTAMFNVNPTADVSAVANFDTTGCQPA